jgi:nitroreductase
MNFSKSVIDIIQQRFSCRKYESKSIDESILNKLQEAIISLPKPPFGSSLRFLLVASSQPDSLALHKLGTYGFIKNPAGFIIGAASHGLKNLEDFGFQMELLILYATDLGLGTCWLGGSFNRSSFAKKINLGSFEEIPAVSSIGLILCEDVAKKSFIRRLAKSDFRLSWQELFFDGKFGNPLEKKVAEPFAQALEMVRIGPSASNKQPWRILKQGQKWHFYLKRTKGYHDNLLVKLLKISDMQRVDMGIAMCHFALTLKELGINGTWSIEDPKIITNDSLTEYSATWTPNE